MDRHEQGECAEPSNPSLPLEVHVRRMLAQDRNTQVRVLQQLAGDEDRAVRAYTARNRSLPVEVLVELARDPDDPVREIATRRLIAHLDMHELSPAEREVADKLASDGWQGTLADMLAAARSLSS